MAEYYTPDQLFAYIAHWRGILSEQQLMNLEKLFEEQLDAGHYQPLGVLAVAAGFIDETTLEIIQRWFPLAELRLEDAYYTHQLAGQIPQNVLDESFLLQENQFLADGSLISVLDILVHNGLITEETIENLVPFPLPEGEDGEDGEDDDYEDAGDFMAPGDAAANTNPVAISAADAAGLLDLVQSAQLATPPGVAGALADIDKFEDDDNPDIGPDLAAQKRASASGRQAGFGSGALETNRMDFGEPPDADDDEGDYTRQVLSLGYTGDPNPETDEGVAFGDKYELYREIERGSHGIVYLGRQSNLGRLVIVRMLPKAALRVPELIQRFRTQATKAGKILHPSLSQIYEVGQVSGRHFVALEYVQGTKLTDYVRQRRKLPARQVIEIALAVARGLDAAFKAGATHGDVRLDNIVLTADRAVKLIGLGLSDAIMPSKSKYRGLALVAPHFCSPEVADGGEPTQFSDMYSLGVCMFVMLTGAFPYFGPRREVILEKHINDQVRRPSDVVGDECPPYIDKVVHRLLIKIPGERFDSYDKLLAVLERAKQAVPAPPPPIVNAPPPVAHPAAAPPAARPGAPPAMGRKGRRKRLKPPTGAAGSGIVPPADASSGSSTQAPAGGAANMPRRRRRRRPRL